MLLIDLFAGRLGWSKGFLAEGWTARAYDLHLPNIDIPEGVDYRLQDILTLTAADLEDADFICASSPCEQFSVHCMKHFHPNPPYPELGIRLFEHTRAICEASGKPYVMENVRCAEKFVGRAVNHCGPFYLWGNAVPAVIPRECYTVTKGTKFGLDFDHFGATGQQWRTMGKESYKLRRENRKKFDMYYKTGSKSKARKEYQAQVAEIPLSLSRYIAQCATRLIDCSVPVTPVPIRDEEIA